MDATAIGTAAIAALASIAGTYVALRRDHRESRAQAISEAKDTIELLR